MNLSAPLPLPHLDLPTVTLLQFQLKKQSDENHLPMMIFNIVKIAGLCNIADMAASVPVEEYRRCRRRRRCAVPNQLESLYSIRS